MMTSDWWPHMEVCQDKCCLIVTRDLQFKLTATLVMTLELLSGYVGSEAIVLKDKS